MLITVAVIVATFVSVVRGSHFNGDLHARKCEQLFNVIVEKHDHLLELGSVQNTLQSMLVSEQQLHQDATDELIAAEALRKQEMQLVNDLKQRGEEQNKLAEESRAKRKRLDRLLRVQKKRKNQTVKGRDLIGFVNQLENAGYSCGLTTQGDGSHTTLELDGHKSTVSGKMKNRHFLKDIHDAMPDLLQNQEDSDATVTEDEIQANWVELQKHRSVLAEIDQEVRDSGLNIEDLQSEIEVLKKALQISEGMVDSQTRSLLLTQSIFRAHRFLLTQSLGRPQMAWEIYDTLMEDLQYFGDLPEFREGVKAETEQSSLEGALGTVMAVGEHKVVLSNSLDLLILRYFDAVMERYENQGLPQDIPSLLLLNTLFPLMHDCGFRSTDDKPFQWDETTSQMIKDIQPNIQDVMDMVQEQHGWSPSLIVDRGLRFTEELLSNLPKVDSETRAQRDAIYGRPLEEDAEYRQCCEQPKTLEIYQRIHQIFEKLGRDVTIAAPNSSWCAFHTFVCEGRWDLAKPLLEQLVVNQHRCWMFEWEFTFTTDIIQYYGKYLMKKFKLDRNRLWLLPIARGLLGNQSWKYEGFLLIRDVLDYYLETGQKGLALKEYVKLDSFSMARSSKIKYRQKYEKIWPSDQIKAAKREWEQYKEAIDASQCRLFAIEVYQQAQQARKAAEIRAQMLDDIQNDFHSAVKMFEDAGLDRTHPFWLTQLKEEVDRFEDWMRVNKPLVQKVSEKVAQKKRGKGKRKGKK